MSYQVLIIHKMKGFLYTLYRKPGFPHLPNLKCWKRNVCWKIEKPLRDGYDRDSSLFELSNLATNIVSLAARNRYFGLVEQKTTQKKTSVISN